MAHHQASKFETLLASTNPAEIREGLRLAGAAIATTAPSDRGSLLEAISALFYIDALEQPDLVPLIEEAIDIVAKCGPSVIPTLISRLNEGDLKAQMAYAFALGRIGADAIQPLITEYRSKTDASGRAFILYALGKIKSPELIGALPLVLSVVHSPILELRDTATRAVGKFAECIPPARLTEPERRQCVDALQKNLADPNSGVRAKAVRSLGKLAHHGHLSAEERAKLKATCLLLLGKDENFEWDRAFIVRKEAEVTLAYT
jgi:HEAT repeat protein